MAGRTDEERMELARQCEKIERKGGNVIEYLKKNGYPYTTSATWANLQKDYLKRKGDRITTGIPEEKPRKEESEMEKGRMARVNSSTLAEEVASVAILSGGDPVQHLREMGYANPSQKWQQLRRILQEENIDLLENVDLAIAARQEKEKALSEPQKAVKEPAKKRTEKLPSEDPEAPQGQNGAERAPVPRPNITTCCAPARPSGVSLEEEESTFCIKAVESKAGTFALGSRHDGVSVMQFASRDLYSTITMTAEEWGILLATAPKALRMLGMIK